MVVVRERASWDGSVGITTSGAGRSGTWPAGVWGAASACNGDSGGPQIRRVGGRWELIGATSRDG
ncbi:trypsin-like serine protease, partial [Streptosporangium canum]|uniref:trypsin-like serine protease n=1 Tax=Streptosporangium canum TaxID=324952 RepID=UPI0034424E04